MSRKKPDNCSGQNRSHYRMFGFGCVKVEIPGSLKTSVCQGNRRRGLRELRREAGALPSPRAGRRQLGRTDVDDGDGERDIVHPVDVGVAAGEDSFAMAVDDSRCGDRSRRKRRRRWRRRGVKFSSSIPGRCCSRGPSASSSLFFVARRGRTSAA
ncbi:hypothetical protein EYF80_066366 [Liparis tanakae]|uniref:Uncharacterized protein n=1 Tax=Liparis tanakae TaxID=230148 RepID=A0A4Z2E497_9TELE|nr:hypothetical protein EYF80_066366 [Liparis tanakae]